NSHLSKYTKMMEKACHAEREAIRKRAEALATVEHRTVKRSLPAVMVASGLWVVLFGLVCNGALRDAVETWAPTFLSEQFGLDSSLAAIISVCIPVVSISGTYIANSLHERIIKNELYTACIMFGVATLCVGGLFLTREASAILCALFMAVSVSAMWGANHMFLTVVPYHFAPLGLSAAVTGMLNSVIYFATALCTGLYGVLAEQVGWNTLILIWLGVGVFGIFFCILGGKLWAKKRGALDEGRI
ncbi:MAG: MFS transporter, partial [Clostridia bacterium]|nr:MFS transporter [Clostridia bacterium]